MYIHIFMHEPSQGHEKQTKSIQLSTSIRHAALRSASIIPNSIHSESLLGNIQPSHPGQRLILEAIHLHETVLVVAQRQPFITKVTGADRIGVTTAVGGGVDEQLSFNVAVRTQLEGSDIPRPGTAVGSARGCKEVLAALRGEADITAVFVRGRDAFSIISS